MTESEMLEEVQKELSKQYLKVEKLQIENEKLKNLVREVQEFIEEENPQDFTIMSERMDELLEKIEEILK